MWETLSKSLEGQPFVFVVLVAVIVGQYIFFTRFIKSLKETQTKELLAKEETIEQLHNKFLMFQTKFIKLLTKLNASLEMSQNNDLRGQQDLKELSHKIETNNNNLSSKIETNSNEIKLLFEKILIKLESS